jgi:hypothetical protein
MSRSPFVASLVLLLVLPAVGWAQDAAAPGGPHAAVFRALQDSQWVRVTTTGGSRHEGMILNRDGPELLVSAERVPLRIPATGIDTLWTRGHSVKQSAMIGSIVGALTGVVFGFYSVQSTAAASEMGAGQAALLAGGVGAASGAVIGTLFGLALPRWKQRLP